jgi:hypothetical protein
MLAVSDDLKGAEERGRGAMAHIPRVGADCKPGLWRTATFLELKHNIRSKVTGDA